MPRERMQRIAQTILYATVFLVSVVVDPLGAESFRHPKQLVLRAGAIAFLAVAAFVLTSPSASFDRIRWRRPELIIPVAVVLWSALTTATSTNRLLSAETLVNVVSSAVFFIGAFLTLQRSGLAALDVIFAASVMNSVIAIAQEYKIWQPLTFPANAEHLATTALIGNPNDVGSYLALPAIAAVVCAVEASGIRRAAYWATSVVLLGGIIASGTRTAIIAYVAGLFVYALLHSTRNAIAVTVLLVIAVFTLTSPRTSLGRRAQEIVIAAEDRRYDVVFSERLPPFLAAADMFKDHPWTGVGPGCFGSRYFRYRILLGQRYPADWTRGWPMNFGETHNDHLQLLAEAGVPAYGLFLTSLVILVWPRIRGGYSPPASIRERLALSLPTPVAATIFVLALAQFPLQLAATRVICLYFIGICRAWLPDAK